MADGDSFLDVPAFVARLAEELEHERLTAVGVAARAMSEFAGREGLSEGVRKVAREQARLMSVAKVKMPAHVRRGVERIEGASRGLTRRERHEIGARLAQRLVLVEGVLSGWGSALAEASAVKLVGEAADVRGALVCERDALVFLVEALGGPGARLSARGGGQVPPADFEQKHPRAPKGRHGGGKFAHKAQKSKPTGLVTSVQERLDSLGYDVPSDGVNQGATTRAVRAFQQKMGLRPTGKVDQATLSLLDREVGKLAKSPKPVGFNAKVQVQEVAVFNPAEHPRGRAGKFVDVLGKLERAAVPKAKVPRVQVNVKGTVGGGLVRERHAGTMSGGMGSGTTRHAVTSEEMKDRHDLMNERSGLKVEIPDSVVDGKPAGGKPFSYHEIVLDAKGVRRRVQYVGGGDDPEYRLVRADYINTLNMTPEERAAQPPHEVKARHSELRYPEHVVDEMRAKDVERRVAAQALRMKAEKSKSPKKLKMPTGKFPEGVTLRGVEKLVPGRWAVEQGYAVWNTSRHNRGPYGGSGHTPDWVAKVEKGEKIQIHPSHPEHADKLGTVVAPRKYGGWTGGGGQSRREEPSLPVVRLDSGEQIHVAEEMLGKPGKEPSWNFGGSRVPDKEEVLFHFLTGKKPPANKTYGTEAWEQFAYKRKGKRDEQDALVRKLTQALGTDDAEVAFVALREACEIRAGELGLSEASYTGGDASHLSAMTAVPYGGMTPFMAVAAQDGEKEEESVDFVDVMSRLLEQAVADRQAASEAGDAAAFTAAFARERVLRARQEQVSEAADSLAKASTPEPLGKPGGPGLWHHKGLQLPAYIQHIARDIMEKRGKDESSAIAIAVGAVKRWARGGGNVDAGTKAAASKALAEWSALKAAH